MDLPLQKLENLSLSFERSFNVLAFRFAGAFVAIVLEKLLIHSILEKRSSSISHQLVRTCCYISRTQACCVRTTYLQGLLYVFFLNSTASSPTLKLTVVSQKK